MAAAVYAHCNEGVRASGSYQLRCRSQCLVKALLLTGRQNNRPVLETQIRLGITNHLISHHPYAVSRQSTPGKYRRLGHIHLVSCNSIRPGKLERHTHGSFRFLLAAFLHTQPGARHAGEPKRRQTAPHSGAKSRCSGAPTSPSGPAALSTSGPITATSDLPASPSKGICAHDRLSGHPKVGRAEAREESFTAGHLCLRRHPCPSPLVLLRLAAAAGCHVRTLLTAPGLRSARLDFCRAVAVCRAPW